MADPALRRVSPSTWAALKCRSEYHLTDPAWLGGAHSIVDRVPAGRSTASTDPWEDARFCGHYVWGVGER